MGRGVQMSDHDWQYLTTKCRLFLIKNFHKFTTDKKITIALEISKKAMPSVIHQENTGEIVIKHFIQEFDLEERANDLIKGRQCIGMN
jgi:hypothetical protein